MVSWPILVLVKGIVRLLTLIDWLFRRLLNKSLVSFTSSDFRKTLSDGARGELSDPDISSIVELYLEGLAKDTRMTFYSRFSQKRFLRMQLEQRAAIRATMTLYPAISATPIRKPIFIIGLPRTGTTLLFNLLSLDPSFRAPMMWEMMRPLPPGRHDDWRSSQRYKDAARVIELHRCLIGQNLDKCHEVRVDNPEECYVMFMRSFLVYHLFVCMPEMAAVADWFYSRSLDYMKRVYRFYKWQLQLLGYDHGMDKRHFLLKSHLHSLCLEALLDTFPDACLVFTHRDLRQVVPSFCSLNAGVSAHIRSPDLNFGKRSLRLLSEIANRAAKSMRDFETQTSAGKSPVLFVNYDDLVKHPVDTVKNIHDYFGLEMSTEEAIEKYLIKNPKGKHGRHTYELSDYGLTPQDIEDTCADYIQYVKDKLT